MSTITPEQYDAVIDVIDSAKTDDKPLDSDEYASAILVALGLSL